MPLRLARQPCVLVQIFLWALLGRPFDQTMMRQGDEIRPEARKGPATFWHWRSRRPPRKIGWPLSPFRPFATLADAQPLTGRNGKCHPLSGPRETWMAPTSRQRGWPRRPPGALTPGPSGRLTSHCHCARREVNMPTAKGA